jgi:RNA polymerase sigma-70 factor (ECF subfamily)
METPDFIARLAAGDQAAFHKLVKHYHPRLLGFAGSIVGENLAEEIVQEAWVSVWRGLPRFEGRAALKTWLYTIVRNECTARLRKDKRMPLVNMDEELYEDGIDAWFAANFVEDGHWRGGIAPWTLETPEQLLEETQLRDCLDRNIASLQAMQRSVFRLRDIDQLGLDEICNILNLSDSNVRVLLHRARLKLLQVINHYQETGEC